MKYLSCTALCIALLFAKNCYAAQPESLSKEQHADLYPTLKEIYDDCKAAVAIADKGDLKGFMDTKCAMQMYGTFTGFITMVYVLNQPALHDPDNKCEANETKIRNEYRNIICFSKDHFTKESIPELLFARDFLSYIENKYSEREPIPNSHTGSDAPFWQLSSIFLDIYKCSASKQGK